MKLKLEYLAGWGIHSVLFSDAVLWERGQPPGIDVRKWAAVREPQSLLLVCRGLIPDDGERLNEWLNERKARRQPGLLADLSGESEERISRSWQRPAVNGNWFSELQRRPDLRL